jgi:hypothetical protein
VHHIDIIRLNLAAIALCAVVAPATGAAAPPPAPQRVTVINESTLPGLARGVAVRLRGCGFSVHQRGATTTAERHDTAIHYAPPAKPEAEQLATTMGLPATALVADVNAKTIVARLGTDQVRRGTPRAGWVLRWAACR